GVPGLGLAGAVVFSMGAVLAGWSLLIFHRKGTTTVPGQVSSAFVTSGPYRISRNPMYGGLVLAYLGEAGILRQIWPLVVVPFTIAYINSIVIPEEEARLEGGYPSDYPRYRARVRRRL